MSPCGPVRQPPQDLPLDQRGEHRGVGGFVEKPQHPRNGVEQVGAGVAGGHRGGVDRLPATVARPASAAPTPRPPTAAAPGRGPATGSAAGVDVVAGDRQVRGDDQALPGPVLIGPVAEQQPLAALGHDDEQRLGQRVVGRPRSRCSPSTAAVRRSGVRMSGRAWAAMRRRISSSKLGADGHDSTEASAARRGNTIRPNRAGSCKDLRWNRSTPLNAPRASMGVHHPRLRGAIMSLDHYVTLGRSGLRVSPFALGAMTFGEDPGGAGTSVEESGADPDDLPRPRRQLRRHRELLHQRPLREDPRRLLRGQPGRREHVVLASKFFTNMYPGDPNGGGAGRSSITRPAARRPCAGCRPTTWTSTGCTTGTGTRRSRRRCARSTTWSGRARSATSGSPTLPAWVTAQAQTHGAAAGLDAADRPAGGVLTAGAHRRG